MNPSQCGLNCKYSVSSLATEAMLGCLRIWLVHHFHKSYTIFFSLRAPDTLLFLAAACLVLQYMHTTREKFRWEKTFGDPVPNWPAPAKSMANSVNFLGALFSSVFNISKEGYSVLQESYGWAILWTPFFQISGPLSQQQNHFIAFLKNCSSSLAWCSPCDGWIHVLHETVSAPYGEFMSPLGDQC